MAFNVVQNVGGDVCGSPKNGIIDVDDSYGDIRLGGDEFPGKSTVDKCSTELLLRAVSEAEAAYKDRACGQQNTSADLPGPHATNAGSCGNVLTFEDPEFMKAIDEMEDGCLDKTRNSVNNKNYYSTNSCTKHGHVLRMSSLEDVDLREPHDRPPPTILLGKENIDTNIDPVDCHVKTWSVDKDRGQQSPIGVDMDRIDNVDLRVAQDRPHSTSLLGCDTIDNNIGPVSGRGKTRSADIDHTLQTNIVAETLSIVGDTNNPPDDRHETLDR
ncbi:predicted protein [Arabidopsis lyrata subsp. lyrata]|uniref:Predicted protein n=1 Tax=Arabidopsis lyrata subsp. lyrata TaxID=81972 RepID=D7MVJ9_ARALL|nr:predicted protein [Arabidopsis lyrata subsp. lyrata]